MSKFVLIAVAFVVLACSSLPSEPSQDCSILDFESGAIDENGDYLQDLFMTQFIIDPRIVASIQNGQLVFAGDSISFQWFMPLSSENQNFYFDFKSIELSASGPVDLTFVGDAFDTLRVGSAGLVTVPDSLFIGTTQIHVFGNAEGLKVDNIEVCNVR